MNAAADDDDDDDDFSTLTSPSDVMEVADAGSQRTTNERLATSASKLISDYILAKLLGTSLARLPTGVILPTLDGLPKFPPVPLPAFPRAYDEVNSRLISSELDTAGAITSSSNKSMDSYVDDARSSQVEDRVDPSADVPVRRVPVTSPSSLHHHLHQHHHRLGVNEVKETLMEWNGDRGKARSVSNAASNLVVFAPLFPRPAVRTPKVVIPTATSVTFQRLPPSTAPSSLSSLRAIVEKSLGEESDESESDATVTITRDMDGLASDDDDHVSENVSTAELEAFKSGPAAEDMEDEQIEDIGLIAQYQDYVTPVTGYHLRPRLLPKATLPHGDLEEPDRTASVSLMLPPDNSPWTISEEPQPRKDEKQLTVAGDDQDEENVIKQALVGDESTDTASVRDSDTTTDPTIYMYTVLSSATRQQANEERDDTDDVKVDVEDDAGYDDEDDVEDGVEYDTRDVTDDIIDDVLESPSTEMSRDDDTSTPALNDIHRLSPEFLRVMQSMWPGLEICAGPQCNTEDTNDARSEATVSPFSELRLNTEFDFPAVTGLKQKLSESDGIRVGEDEYRDSVDHTASTRSVTTKTLSAGDVTQSPSSATTPSSWQVRGPTSFQTDVTITSPSHSIQRRPVKIFASDQLTLSRRKNVRPDKVAADDDSDMKMTSDKNHQKEQKTTSTLRPTTTVSHIELMGNRFALPIHRQQASLTGSGSMPSSRPVNTLRKRPALGVPATRRVEEPIRRQGRPFHVHRLRADPTRREKPPADAKQRPFRQRHGFIPPNFSFHRNPTIVRPRSDLRGLSDRRRGEIVDKDSGLLRSSAADLQMNEEALRRFGSPFTVHRHVEPTDTGLSHDRTAIVPPQGDDYEELRDKKTTSTLRGKPADEVREENVVSGPSATNSGGRNQESGKNTEDTLRSRITESSSTENQQEMITVEQTTHRSSGRASWSSSRKYRGQNVKDEGSKTSQFANNSSKASVSTSTDVITGTSLSTGRKVDVESGAAFRSTTSSQRQQVNSQQTTSDKIQPALTATSKQQDVTDPLHTASSQTTVVRAPSGDPTAVSPGEREPLPVQARPGENGHSAAAMAMLGGYADWMVGLISAVAVAVFIFLAILSFLAVVSCRCVSSR